MTQTASRLAGLVVAYVAANVLWFATLAPALA